MRALCSVPAVILHEGLHPHHIRVGVEIGHGVNDPFAYRFSGGGGPHLSRGFWHTGISYVASVVLRRCPGTDRWDVERDGSRGDRSDSVWLVGSPRAFLAASSSETTASPSTSATRLCRSSSVSSSSPTAAGSGLIDGVFGFAGLPAGESKDFFAIFANALIIVLSAFATFFLSSAGSRLTAPTNSCSQSSRKREPDRDLETAGSPASISGSPRMSANNRRTGSDGTISPLA